MNAELIRLVDSIHRDKDVNKDIIFEALEAAMLSAARKQFGNRPEVTVQINRETGDIVVSDGETQLDTLTLGRISAQTAKQIIIQRIREAERDVVFQDYERRVGEIVNGVIQRSEGSSVVVNLGKTEGYLPRREQVPGENYRPGERIRALVTDVKKIGPKVKITLSRSHPDIIRRLFEIEVPEISDHTIEVKALAREPGARTKIGVFSTDSKVDCVGACVGVRGTRIKNIVDELNGEKIDIVRWSDSTEMFIANALRPAEISSIFMDSARRRAVVLVPEDQLALGIGKRGQNVRLASKLVGWNIDIFTATEFENRREQAKKDFAQLPGIDERLAAKLVESGVYSLSELADSEPEHLTRFDEIKAENVDALQGAALEMLRARRKEMEAQAAAASAAAAAASAAAAAASAAAAAAGAAAAATPGAPSEAVPAASPPPAPDAPTAPGSAAPATPPATARDAFTSSTPPPSPAPDASASPATASNVSPAPPDADGSAAPTETSAASVVPPSNSRNLSESGQTDESSQAASGGADS